MEFSVFTFPFEQIGWGLRQLSLSGAVGNIVAIIVFVLIGFIPYAVFMWLKKKGTACKVDWMLPALSVCLFIVLYFMINPGLIATPIPGEVQALLGSTFYSVLVGYLVLRVLEKSALADTKSLQKGLCVLLYIVMLLFAYVVVEELIFSLPAKIQAVREVNTADNVDLTMTYIFLVLQSAINVLPYVLDIVVLFVAVKTLKELLADAYSDATVRAVKRIADVCTKTLTIIVVASMGFNILQLVFRNSLQQIHISVTIPILSILLVVVILMVARYVQENQKLKQDNDLFI